ncbi:MAG TPA: excinuclease ABC subunit UvrA [Gemmataceae bacterium]|nr:excinuclease ABC subunit UvrA [Gemmataceae bacterium]
MDNDTIVIRGAREHNLRNVHLELPRNALIVFTGVSGSGKSSLAFDTLYAEGQRRYVESLSSYARQFLGQLPKPDVDYLGGLSPAISIQQKTAARNPRSTVGTITEIHDYLRVLYARVGQGHCPQCGRPITAQGRDQIFSRILALAEGARFLVLAPVVRGQKGEFKDLFADMLKRGFVRARIDGEILRLSDESKLDRRMKHDIAIVIDRLVNEPKVRTRLAEAVEQALALADGNLIVAVEHKTEAAARGSDSEFRIPNSEFEDILLSAKYACLHCNISYDPPTPQLFSFNNPQGMCLDCDGLGMQHTFDPELLIPDPEMSFFDGAIPIVGPMRGMGKWRKHIFEGVAKTLGIDLKQPWKDTPKEHQDWLLSGSGSRHITFEWKQRGGSVWKHGGKWEGIIPQLLSSFKKTAAGPRRLQLEKYMRVVRCPTCHGKRLNAQARALQVSGQSIVDAEAMTIGDMTARFAEGGKLEQGLDPVQKHIASELLKEIRARLKFLLDVGLHYLTLDRSAPTLSGGEAQRIRLAGQIGSGLVGVLYILDEPSIGLHPRDNDRLLRSLERLRDMGNSVLVVEHDEETMRAADYIVDFGPGPGVRGGEVVAAGSFTDVLRNRKSLTGQYLSGERSIAIPEQRRSPNGKHLRILGARHHNLKDINVDIPLGVFVCVTGVSGSGKSSLINDILFEGLRKVGMRSSNDRNGSAEEEDTEAEISESNLAQSELRDWFDSIKGVENIDKVIAIDQSPIGRTPRSNPATYIKVFDEIRSLYAEVTDAKIRGYQPGRFSFNRPGGRCEACEGNGSNRLEMDFLADVWVTCPVCEGKRFNRETLQVRYRGKNIHDVLEMDVQEALQHFEHHPKVSAMLQTLHDVGMDYIKLGQPSPTLSGGEAQRIKLARELCKRSTGKTLYILDEPTTGLHFEDIRKLLEVLHGFANAGNTVVVIEHNLDVIKTADWIIDLGPEGGAGGGEIVATGTPEQIAACERSFTGQGLRPVLKRVVASSGRTTNGKPLRKKGTGTEHITHLEVVGACEHNLKNIKVRLPREAMSVCSGPSGSGKSSLALDTIYAEGQRRYVESLSSYARQFLGQVQKPKVEQVSGLSPAISIEQKTTSKSPRSTVGTVTEIYDYLRVLYARLGQHYCPACGIPVGTQTADEIVDKVLALPEGAKIYLLAPIERKGQEKYETIWEDVRRSGFMRIRVDGKSYSIDEPPAIDHRRKHEVQVVVDRIAVRSNQRSRIADTVEAALDLGRGVTMIAHVDPNRDEPEWRIERFSQHLACENCGRSFEPLNPHHFSFNSPLGWCPTCEGLGVQQGAKADLLIRNPQLSLREGAIAGWPDVEPGKDFTRFVEALAKFAGFSLDTSFEKLLLGQQRAILHGTGEAWIELPASNPKSEIRNPKFQYKGLFPALNEASRVSPACRQRLDHLVSEIPCSACGGSRLRDDAAAVRFDDLTLGQLCHLPLSQTLNRFDNLKLTAAQRQVAGEVLREIHNRLQFLVDVGLDYLSLSRPGPTLSGGEAQRIRLASQIGSGLTGVLYVLDEPTIGLHPRDNELLLGALQRLRDLGNTLVLVEHDREVIAAADYLLDFGPGAGDRGGEITAAGTPKQVLKSRSSLTGQYLSGKKAIPVPSNRRPASPQAALKVLGARHNNLKNINVSFPLGCLIAVTGVSGSGKSSLIQDVLYNTLSRRLHRARTVGAAHDDITGLEHIDKIISVDQEPIGNSPSSNPATYTGVFDLVRQLFAQLPEAKVRGYQPMRFSFNKRGGRCEACEGNGQKKIEMHFLPDVWVECDVCHGSRYNPETLAVKYKGKSIADVLQMRVSEALELFGNIPKIRAVLQTLADVGLDYVQLGQPAPTLSGGEAQRVKLAAELARPSTGRTLYILDEPTTGLHFDDIRKLLDVLNRLIDLGNTAIVVEHNLDVIKTADWVIDLGPEAGERGGFLVAEGTPEQVAAVAESRTASFLAQVLKAGPRAERSRFDPNAALAAREGDLELEAVGQDAQLPWEADGLRWHTVDRVTTKGRPGRWDPAILTWVIDQVHRLGDFSETNWNHRSIVEIAAKNKSQGWFLHAMTGQEWVLRLVFRVARNSFKQEKLARQLDIPPLDENVGAEAYREDRVQVANRKGPWQEVAILAFRLEDIDTKGFRGFLKEAVAAFQANLKRMLVRPEDVMPWKVNGERWHLSDKGFPPGRKIRWDRAILPKMIRLMRQVEPKIEISWDTRDAILFYVPGINKSWARFRTKDETGLDCRFLGPPGQFNLSRIDRFGISPNLSEVRSDGQMMQLRFLDEDHLHLSELRELLTEHLRGFREMNESS